jgi:hypothetical protein
MKKGSIRKPLSGKYFELSEILAPVLKAFHKNSWETFIALIFAHIMSGTCKFQRLCLHLLVGTSPDAKERRLERYLHEFKFDIETAWHYFAVWIIGRHIGTDGEVFISIDWTESDRICTLTANILLEGRSIPLWAKTYFKGRGCKGKQIAIEKQALDVLSRLKNDKYKIIVIGDRGFGNRRMAEGCKSHKLDYIFRIKGNIWVKSSTFDGYISAVMFVNRKSTRHDNVTICFDETYQTDLIAVPGRKTRRNSNPEDWYLITSLEGSPEFISDCYSHRWGCECSYDDIKNEMGYQKPKWKSPEPVDRIWLIHAITVELALSAGASERENHPTRPCKEWEIEQRCVKRRYNRVRLISFFLAGLAILRLGVKSLHECMFQHKDNRCLLLR